MIPGVEVVRHPRARVARLSVDPATGRVRLTVPARMAVKKAVAWAEQQQAWIAAQRARLPQGRPFVPGAVIPVADDRVMLHWDEGALRSPMRTGDLLLCGGPRAGFEARIERWLKREALRILAEDTAYYADRAGVTVAQVAVGDPRARWGSCSSSGAIRYSWRLLLAPAFVRRSTAAHEVAHRVHMHHGPDFHALVARLFEGDPDEARRWLRREGAALHWFGRDSSSS